MSEKIDERSFYDDINPPEQFGFIINPKGCVIMNFDSLMHIVDYETKQQILEYVRGRDKNDGN